MLRLLVLSVCLAAIGCSDSLTPPTETVKVDTNETTTTPAPASLQVHGFYSVDEYDESRDSASDLVATAKLAQAGNKHILLEVGGDW